MGATRSLQNVCLTLKYLEVSCGDCKMQKHFGFDKVNLVRFKLFLREILSYLQFAQAQGSVHGQICVLLHPNSALAFVISGELDRMRIGYRSLM